MSNLNSRQPKASPNQHTASDPFALDSSAGSALRGGAFRYSVAFKLISLVFGMVALILAIILFFLGFRISQSEREQANKQLIDSSVTLSRSFQIWLDGSQSALLNLAAQPDIQSMQAGLQVPVMQSLVQTHKYMLLASTVGLDGVNIARSDDAGPSNYADFPWFQAAVNGEELAYQTRIGTTGGKPVLIMATPIRSGTPDGKIIGVAMFQADLGSISQIVEQVNLGSTGIAYIIDPMNRVIAHTRSEYSERLEDFTNYPPVAALRNDQKGLQTFEDAAGLEWRAATVLLPGGWGLVVQQTAEESTAAMRSNQRLVLILAAFALLMTLGVVWLAIRRSLQPINELSETAQAIAQGNFYRQANVRTKDEFALLADVVNQMATQMRELVERLEQRVSERTKSLERRTTQLEAAAQVARSAAGIRDLKQLFAETVQLISRRFGFYHAGIFIIDEIGEYAILQAANSPGGQRMLQRGHQLRVGQVGIVGYVAATGRPRIALDVGEDAVYFNNPDLPQTRSEMALPLKVSGKAIGVLDVQSTQANAFIQEDVEVLQLLADQIALAIESARRLQESQDALAELNAVYGERTRQSWQERLRNKSLAYHYDRTTVDAAGYGQVTAVTKPALSAPASRDAGNNEEAGEPGDKKRVLELPISFRDQGLGAIRLRRAPDQAPWTEEEQELVREALTQIAPALENARLLEEIQQRAHHESLLARFSSRVQASLDLETLLRTAVGEINEVIDASRIRIRITEEAPQPGAGKQEKEPDAGEGGDQ